MDMGAETRQPLPLIIATYDAYWKIYRRIFSFPLLPIFSLQKSYLAVTINTPSSANHSILMFLSFIHTSTFSHLRRYYECCV